MEMLLLLNVAFWNKCFVDKPQSAVANEAGQFLVRFSAIIEHFLVA